MITILSIAVGALVFMLLVALLYTFNEKEIARDWAAHFDTMREERDEARQTLALLTRLPEGMCCSTGPLFFIKHFYDGAPACRRCHKPSPYLIEAKTEPDVELRTADPGEHPLTPVPPYIGTEARVETAVSA